MKKILFLLFVIYIAGPQTAMYAQLGSHYRYFPTSHVFPNVVLGTMAPENGFVDTTYLYDWTDEGKPIIVFLYNAVDSLAWGYHNSNALQDLYTSHGPSGDNTINVLGLTISGYWPFLGYTSPDNPTLGDWSANTPYPVREGWDIWAYDLHRLQWPQVFCVCPDKRAYQLGLWNADSLYEVAINCGLATAPNDAQIIWSDVDTSGSCIGESRPLNAFLSNIGTEPLTSAAIEVRANGQVIQTYPWEGNLPTYHIDTINLNDLPTTGQAIDLQLVATNINNTSDANHANDTLTHPIRPATIWEVDSISIDIMTTSAAQIYWEVNDENGITIDSGGCHYLANNPYYFTGSPENYLDNTLAHETVSLIGYDRSCFSIKLISGAGLGLYYGYGNPDECFFRVKRGNDIMFEWRGWSHFAYAQIYTHFGYDAVTATYDIVNTVDAAPNGSITITASAGVPPYQYSIDCGETYGTDPVFSGLLAGSYCVAIMDSIGQVVLDTVEVQSITATDASLYGYSSLSIQPNPAKDQVQVLLSGITETTDAQFQLLNADGQVLQTGVLQQQGGTYRIILSLAKLPIGVYFVRVTTPLVTRVAKVVKSE